MEKVLYCIEPNRHQAGGQILDQAHIVLSRPLGMEGVLVLTREHNWERILSMALDEASRYLGLEDLFCWHLPDHCFDTVVLALTAKLSMYGFSLVLMATV